MASVAYGSGIEHRHTTSAAKASLEMGGLPEHIGGEKPIVEGHTVSRAQVFDKYSISDEERKTYNIADGEQHVWKANPDKYQGTYLDEWLREKPGRRVIKKDGQFVTNYDHIMCVKSKAEIEEDDRIRNAAVDRDYRPGRASHLSELRRDVEDHPQFDKNSVDPQDVLERSEAAHDSGLIGSFGSTPTSGMSWMEAEARMKKQYGATAVEDDQSFYRGRSTHSDERNRREMGKGQDIHQPRSGKVHPVGIAFDASGKRVG